MDVFTAISLCSGYEGLGLGLKRAIPNLRTICYVENEAYAIANLVAKIKEKRLDDAPIWDDLKTFDPKPFTGLVDVIHSGFPCQPFSVAGKRKGKEDERHLWPYIKRAVGIIQPEWVFLENVPGLILIGLREVLLDLEKLGYRVESDSGEPTWGLFTASEVGAPHKRERLFILADTNEQGRQKRGFTGQLPKTKAIPCTAITGSCDEWPSRPGQPQYEWEEPRVVADTERVRPVQSESTPRHRQRVSENRNIAGQENNTTEGQAQSGVGGAVDGTKSRVDRLRLLGNGVVPQCAELAFRTLMAMFKE